MNKAPYRTIVFCSNDIFSGIMLRGLLACDKFSVEKVCIEKERMGKNNNLKVFSRVAKKSGLRYALYQGTELIIYSALMKLLSLFNPSSLQAPKKQCNRHLIPCEEVSASTLNNSFLDERPYEILFCFRFSKILKGDLLSIAKIASINFHGSLLPKYAGLGSIFQAIKHQEQEIGGSFHLMVEKIDGGNVIAQSKFPVDYSRSVSYHHLRVYQESSKLFHQVAHNIINGVSIANDSSEEEYFTFPEKEDVRGFQGNLFDLRDVGGAAEIIVDAIAQA